MTSSDYIAIGSLGVSVLALAYAYFSSTKRYELKSQYRQGLLSWYNDTIQVLVRLRVETNDPDADADLKKELLARLSANVELGRFYFPNVMNGTDYGDHKPKAYRGYRNVVLDFLVFSYEIFSRKDAVDYLEHAQTLQRYFTSSVFELLEPRKFLRETRKYTSKSFSQELRFEDYIKNEPELLYTYLQSIHS